MSEFQPIPTSPRFQDLTGRTFGRLTVIGYLGRRHSASYWQCKCSCLDGNITEVNGQNLKLGTSTSCGCARREGMSKRRKSHGQSKGRIYRCWINMKLRCYDDKEVGYRYYGGRGIAVCKRWLESFENFLADMGQPPTAAHTLDRKDTNASYSPENCKWSTYKEQANNRTNNRLSTIDGVTRNTAQWSEISGLPPNVIHQRLGRGWDAKAAVFTPAKLMRRMIEFRGESKFLTQWAKDTRLPVAARLNLGWSIERALTEPLDLAISEGKKSPD